MSGSGPQGSYVVAIAPSRLRWAVREVVRALAPEQIGRLKISSGEHLAAILATAFLGAAPVSTDVAGQPDLIFDLPSTPVEEQSGIGLGPGLHAFEVKSLAGGFRRYTSSIDYAERNGLEARKAYTTTFTSLNDVISGPGRDAISKAKQQLERKQVIGCSKNIFLVSHLFDHLPIELLKEYLIAHLLDPLTDIDGIETVWALWAPSHLVMWSATDERWISLLFNMSEPEFDHLYPDELEILQHIDAEFLSQIGYTGESPYLFNVSGNQEKQKK